MIYNLFFCVIFLFFSCNGKKVKTGNVSNRIDTIQVTLPDKQNKSITKSDSIRYEIFKSTQGWGYDIFLYDKRYVHQPFIPGISGEVSFKSQANAEQVASLVIRKLVLRIVPPSVSPTELDSLNIKY